MKLILLPVACLVMLAGVLSGCKTAKTTTTNPPPPTDLPEPSGIVLIGTGILGILVTRQRRK
jgi:hypothetical protein